MEDTVTFVVVWEGDLEDLTNILDSTRSSWILDTVYAAKRDIIKDVYAVTVPSAQDSAVEDVLKARRMSFLVSR